MTKDYPSDWDSRRKKVYKRDNYTCQNCGRKGRKRGPAELHAHHIVPKSSGGTHQLSNLQTLCSDCHNAIHGNSIAPTEQSQEDTRITKAGTFTRINDLISTNIKDCPLCGEKNMGKYTTNRHTLLTICTSCGSIFKHEDGNQLIGGNKEFLIDKFGKSGLKEIWEYGLTTNAWNIIRENNINRIDIKQLKTISDSKLRTHGYIIFATVMTMIGSVLIPILTSNSVLWIPLINLAGILTLKLYFSFNQIDPNNVVTTTSQV